MLDWQGNGDGGTASQRGAPVSTCRSCGRDSVWPPAVLMGLASSSFSTLVVVLTTRRTGRSPALSWMEVATVALGDRTVRSPFAHRWTAGLAPGVLRLAMGPPAEEREQ